MKITNFKDEYLPQLQEISFFMWLRVQWDSTIMRDNVFAAIDEKEQLLGICALCCDGTWYYLDEERTDIPLYRLQMEVCTKEEISNADQVERELIHAAKQRLLQLKEKYPDKKLCIRCWCEEKDYHKQQQLLVRFWLQEVMGKLFLLSLPGISAMRTLQQKISSRFLNFDA